MSEDAFGTMKQERMQETFPILPVTGPPSLEEGPGS